MTSTLTRYPSYLATGPSRRHSCPLPSFIAQLLANPPENGVHAWIFECARVLKPWRPEEQTAQLIAQAAQRCRRPVHEREIREAVRNAKNNWPSQPSVSTRTYIETAASTVHLPPRRPIHKYNHAVLKAFAARYRGTAPTVELLREITWVDLPPESDQRGTSRLFLENCYAPGERVLLFTNYKSQGDFMYIVGQGCYKLGKNPTDALTPCDLPTSGPCGVWILSNPVTGQWTINDSRQLSRRSWQNITRFRYLVLESDEAPTEEWLTALLQLRLPIVAIYTSGGRSIHALVRIDADDRAASDVVAKDLKDYLAPLGADPAALTSVRLTRLPGTLRRGNEDSQGNYNPLDEPRMQCLLWLADAPATKSIAEDLRPF